MTDFNAAKIIRETRQTKHYLAISSVELDYITACPTLSDGEKLIWITLANKSGLDANYSCAITQGELARQVGKTIGTVTRAITNLRLQGFLTSVSEAHGALTYFLSFPQEGLKKLLSAPDRKSQEDLSKKAYPSIEKGRTPLAKMIDIFNINNKINNIKHNHDAHVDFPLTETPDALDADALFCDFKNLQEKYKNLPLRQQIQQINSHFSPEERIKLYDHQRALNALQSPTPEFKAKLEQAAPVPQSRVKRSDIKLIEFELDGELFLVEEEVRDKILNQIPHLYQLNKIQGTARHKPINALIKEILFYVSKAGSKTLEACQLKRFHTARKLCLKGAWERPNGLERQASIIREKRSQEYKIAENKAAKAFAQELIQNVA